MISIGKLVPKQPWYNAGYIFPLGYSVQVEYKNIPNPNLKSLYTCEILENEAKPLFRVAQGTFSFTGKSPTACWKQVLDMINQTLKANSKPQVKTQVAGPEYFGLNDPVIVEAIEALDPSHSCELYWREKENILKAREAYQTSGSKKERKRTRHCHENEDDSFENYGGAWSTIQRRERYVNRLANLGEEIVLEDSNPIPDYEDEITLQPIVAPAISPHGHIAGYYSWKQALKETDGVCPFTKLPLTSESLVRLTKTNWEVYKNSIKNYSN